MSVARSVVLFTALTFFSWSALADSSLGSIRGNTQPHQQVVIVNSDTGGIEGVMSDDHGDFHADDLKPGQYQVAVKSSLSKATGAPVFAGRTTTVHLPGK